MTTENALISTRDLLVEDGDDSYDTESEVGTLIQNAATGTYVKIWALTVPAQVVMSWGYGSPEYPRNQGYGAFAAVDSDTANEFCDGILELRVTNAPGTQQMYIARFSTSRMHTSTRSANAAPSASFATSIDSLVPIPEIGVSAAQDSRLELWFNKTASSSGIDKANFRLPATIYTV